MRSYSGCLTCKRRKLKFDESKPDQEVGPSAQKRKYRSSKRQRRHSEPRDNTTWVEVPSDLTFVHEDLTNTESPRLLPSEQAISNGESSSLHNSPATAAGTDVLRDNATPARLPHASFEIHPAYIALNDSAAEEGSIFCPRPQGDILGSEKVVASHLLRHFKTGPGQWMDLFDTTAYFSSKVPVFATSKPLLRSAICALSAKHLRHLSQHANIDDDENFRTPTSRTSAHVWGNEETWKYYSAMYYDQALNSLKNIVTLGSYLDNPTDKEEMLAAVAILCTFELMGAPDNQHPAIVIPQTAVKGPIFWSLARQDLLCAFISESQTRLNLTDMHLWQNAGLATDCNGDILPYSPLNVLESQNLSGLGFEEDKKSNELTWILGKITNHLTAGDALSAEDNKLPPDQRLTIGLTQQHLLQRWNLLMADLEKWHDSLPPSFFPSGRTQKLGPIIPGLELTQSFNTFEQIWFDLPLAAATIQSYHQAKILLLANEPQESTALRSTVSARLRSYRHALEKVIHHAREICGISLANSTTDSFRVNSVQALFVAGQVFQDEGEQNAIMELLFEIERDIGWTTKFHIAKLKDEWEKGKQGNHVERDEHGSSPHWSVY
ncbi:hypothetical protein N7509_006134 [Penicillium cosmopolitanum]|uniref:Transcription factor domain-containing protein n=1 Tax=Penicillium cosmopolitanum TaxID=1131564 RepID=A0A9W9W3Z1_9EURO|nr:uncharacterized protein N7509_006134 [Penicillium cosmopolitanum]KAJ5398021.1 hypothetical protein N7509_006134 [Penicillium cosmopolitanum]